MGSSAVPSWISTFESLHHLNICAPLWLEGCAPSMIPIFRGSAPIWSFQLLLALCAQSEGSWQGILHKVIERNDGHSSRVCDKEYKRTYCVLEQIWQKPRNLQSCNSLCWFKARAGAKPGLRTSAVQLGLGSDQISWFEIPIATLQQK